MKKITLSTRERTDFIDVTKDVQRAISESDVKNGFCTVYIPHTTAGITINEGADPAVVLDISRKLEMLIPKDENYLHSEGNSDAHIKSSLIGNSVTIPIHESNLILGTWQSIFFCEFDGPRLRNFYIKITGQ
ncbi:MAG: secondary thiamine-phosphate synthase enzyme YjbQ [Candidatus Diapherotrites archaeon]